MILPSKLLSFQFADGLRTTKNSLKTASSVPPSVQKDKVKYEKDKDKNKKEKNASSKSKVAEKCIMPHLPSEWGCIFECFHLCSCLLLGNHIRLLWAGMTY